ncbi:manganese-dependent inorganic pyrophosphatase [candidate division WWE3 bacterium]|nr:manganese-dependent inorganic pyrophosphatase [candidate division WWE3 bacterium]
MKIYITGHTNPDLDTVASAYEYAEFLKKSKRYEGAEIIPVRSGEINKETLIAFEKFGAKVPESIEEFDIEASDAIILVDHNEESQRHPKVKGEQVIEIVDHHKINVNFNSPVRIDVKPVGCTGTIIHELFNMYGIKPSKETAGLMLCGILSDTVGLKSGTTTGMDSSIAHDIAKEQNIELEKLTFELFKAKSDITGMSPTQLAKKDFKVFDFGGTKVFINQIETVEPEKVIEMKDVLIKVMDEVKAEENASQGYIFITDILKVNSQALYSNEVEKAVIEKAFTTQGINGIADIGPKMSRKKDIAPAIEKALQS